MTDSPSPWPGGAPHVPLAQLPPADVRLHDLLTVEQTGPDRFTAPAVYDSDIPSYGGQIAAQALLAAGRTVAAGRLPHSVHVTFLDIGSTRVPVDFSVERDRDGGSISARRVWAEQDGRRLLTLSASFAVAQAEPQDDLQVARMPEVPPPSDIHAPPRLVEFERSIPPLGHPLDGMPTRFWARCTATDLSDDPLVDAAVITYLSDFGTGHDALPGSSSRLQPSLDHALWLHRPGRAGDWMLVDFQTSTVGHGRGFYTGTLWHADGALLASLAQETLYRRPRPGSRMSTTGRPQLGDLPLGTDM
ncbi:MAG: tesB [Frankiales bacterium]|nr:tesB [Frankiales bacterium]